MQSVNEGLVLAQLEAFEFFKPMPSPIPLGEGTLLETKLDELSATLGGSARTLIAKEGDDPARYDTYVDAAIGEIVSAFMRARTSVCRTHLYFIGSSLIELHPECMNLPEDANVRRSLTGPVEASFLEHAETSCIRLASFWDRMGQLLDFIFFNIRQFERDGFPSVLDRIKINILPISPALRNSQSWARIRKYQTSEETGGLKWLVRRRNLLVHSLHLSPMREIQEDQIFASAYNHLEESVKEKLRPGDKEWELNQMHEHLNAAASLFLDNVELALLGVSITRHD